MDVPLSTLGAIGSTGIRSPSHLRWVRLSVSSAKLLIGTAGWAIPRVMREHFPIEGTGLQRYAAVFSAVEINSTFYRSHRPQTFIRWKDSTPPHFRFSVKLPRALTHEARMQGCGARLKAFVGELSGLEDKLAALLVQLPPSLTFEPGIADDFFGSLATHTAKPLVCGPRHPSWFTRDAETLLAKYGVARVAADPPRHADAMTPGGCRQVAYWRMHGSPRIYYSSYGASELSALADAIGQSSAPTRWCIFDNTTSGAAAANGLDLANVMAPPALRGQL